MQLRRVAHFAYGDSLADQSRAAGTVPVYGSNGVVGVHDTANTHAPAIIVGRKGSFGKVQYSAQPVFAIDTTFYVDSSQTAADLRWLYYVLSVAGLDSLSEDVGVPGLSRDRAYDLRVALPPLVEQRAIADYLDAETARIDAVIEKKRNMVELLRSRYESSRATLILRGLDPITGAGEVPRGWNLSPLGVLIALHRGFDLPADDRVDGPFPIISSGGVSGWHSEKGREGPGVVTGRYGTVGEVFFVEGAYWPLNTTLFVSEFRGNHPRWVFHLLAVMPLDFDAAKSAVTGINRNVIGALRAPRPPLADQIAIAAMLDIQSDAAEKIIEPLRRQIALLEERRQTLVNAAVTGELAIPGVAA